MRIRPRLANIVARDVRGAKIEGRLEEDRVRRALSRIVNENVLCSMATITQDGRPHINTAYFGFSDRLEIYFLSHPGSLHSRNLTANPSMCLTICSSSQPFGTPGRGLQLVGKSGQARGRKAERAERLYAKRFTPYARRKARLKSTDAAREYRFYRFVPRRLKIFDEREFGDAVWVSATLQGGSNSTVERQA